MPVRKLDNGQWVADFYTVDRSNGKRGKRVRKNLPPKVKRWRLKITPSRKWRTHRLGQGKDKRRLSDLIHLWFERHGITLRDGEKRKSAMLWADECMGSPMATEFTAQLFTAYRAKRLDGHFARTKRVTQVSPRTMNWSTLISSLYLMN